jgi:hypothetical protein
MTKYELASLYYYTCTNYEGKVMEKCIRACCSDRLSFNALWSECLAIVPELTVHPVEIEPDSWNPLKEALAVPDYRSIKKLR